MVHVRVFLLSTLLAVACSQCPHDVVLHALESCGDVTDATMTQYEVPEPNDLDYHKFFCCFKAEEEDCVRRNVTDVACHKDVEDAVNKVWNGDRRKFSGVECKHNCTGPLVWCPRDNLFATRNRCLSDAGLTRLPGRPSEPVDPEERKQFCCTVKKLHACEMSHVENIACRRMVEVRFKEIMEFFKEEFGNAGCDDDCADISAHCPRELIEKVAVDCVDTARTEHKDLPTKVDPSSPEHHKLYCCMIQKAENCAKAEFKDAACSEAIEQYFTEHMKVTFNDQKCKHDCGFNGAHKHSIAWSIAAVAAVSLSLAARGNV